MRSSKLLLYTLSIASVAILPTLQHTAKGPQYLLQEPAPVNFVQSILANNEPKDYCNVSIYYLLPFQLNLIQLVIASRSNSRHLLRLPKYRKYSVRCFQQNTKSSP
jgi:hypothetical protein